MAEEIGSLHINMTLTNAEFKAGMTDVSNRLKIAQSEFKLAGAGIKDFGKSMDGLKAKSKYLEDTLRSQQEKVDFLRQRYEQLKSTQGENAAATQRMLIAYNNAQAAMRTTQSRLEDVNGQITVQSSRWHQLGEQLTEAGNKFNAVGDKMKGIGEGMSKYVTAPILAVGAAGLAAFGQVDEALDTIITKTGATGDTADKLAENFRNVASKVPDDLTSVGEAVGEVNTQFGFMGKELEDNSQLMLQFASINKQDVASSALAAKQSIEAYGLANKDLGSVLDAITKTSQKTGQATQDLFAKVIAGAPQIKALGLSFAEGTALIGNFEKSGVDSSAALGSLSKATIAFAKDGKTLQKGLQDTIAKITGAKTETDALTEASKVFGSKGATRMVDAIKRGTFSFKEFAKAGEDAAGATKDTFEATVDPIDQAAIAANNAKLALADVGNEVQIALLPFFNKATEKLKEASTWFRNLSDESKKNILVWGGIAAAIGPVLVISGMLISSVGTIVTAFGAASTAIAGAGGLAGALTLLTGPIGLTIAGVGLVTAAVLAFKNGAEESTNVNLDHTKSLIDQQQSLETLTGKYEELRDKNNLSNYELLRFRDIQSELKTAKSADEIKKLKDEAEKLREKSGLSNGQLTEMLSLNDKLIEKVPIAGQAFSDQGNKILTNADDLHQANNKMRENIQLELELQKTKAEAKLDQNIRDQINNVDILNKKVIDLNNAKIEAAAKEFQLEQMKKQQQDAYAAGQKALGDSMGMDITRLQQEVKIQNDNVNGVASEVQEKQKAVNKTTEQITKTQALFGEMINLQLAQAGINAKGQEGISQLDQAVKKTVDRKAELLRIQSKYGDLNESQKKELQNLDGSLDKYRTAKKSIQEIQGEQQTVNKKIDDGTSKAGAMSKVLSGSEVKSIKFTGDGYREAKIISNEAGAGVKKEISVTDYGKTHSIHTEAGKGASKTISIGASISSSFTKAVKAFEKMSGINIPGFANGTRNAPGGLAWVGENGPELTYLPRGAKVIPNRQSEQLLRNWNIPMLADGGSALSSGLALVGERGRELMDMFGSTTKSNNMNTSGGGGNTYTNNFYPQKAIIDQKDIVRELQRMEALYG